MKKLVAVIISAFIFSVVFISCETNSEKSGVSEMKQRMYEASGEIKKEEAKKEEQVPDQPVKKGAAAKEKKSAEKVNFWEKVKEEEKTKAEGQMPNGEEMQRVKQEAVGEAYTDEVQGEEEQISAKGQMPNAEEEQTEPQKKSNAGLIITILLIAGILTALIIYFYWKNKRDAEEESDSFVPVAPSDFEEEKGPVDIKQTVFNEPETQVPEPKSQETERSGTLDPGLETARQVPGTQEEPETSLGEDRNYSAPSANAGEMTAEPDSAVSAEEEDRMEKELKENDEGQMPNAEEGQSQDSGSKAQETEKSGVRDAGLETQQASGTEEPSVPIDSTVAAMKAGEAAKPVEQASRPGVGTATVSPMQVSSGTQEAQISVIYKNAEDVREYRTIRVTVPEGLTAPSDTEGDPGFIVVSATGGEIISKIIEGMSVTVNVHNLPAKTGEVRISFEKMNVPDEKGMREFVVEADTGISEEMSKLEDSPGVEII